MWQIPQLTDWAQIGLSSGFLCPPQDGWFFLFLGLSLYTYKMTTVCPNIAFKQYQRTVKERKVYPFCKCFIKMRKTSGPIAKMGCMPNVNSLLARRILLKNWSKLIKSISWSREGVPTFPKNMLTQYLNMSGFS